MGISGGSDRQPCSPRTVDFPAPLVVVDPRRDRRPRADAVRRAWMAPYPTLWRRVDWTGHTRLEGALATTNHPGAVMDRLGRPAGALRSADVSALGTQGIRVARGSGSPNPMGASGRPSALGPRTIARWRGSTGPARPGTLVRPASIGLPVPEGADLATLASAPVTVSRKPAWLARQPTMASRSRAPRNSSTGIGAVSRASLGLARPGRGRCGRVRRRARLPRRQRVRTDRQSLKDAGAEGRTIFAAYFAQGWAADPRGPCPGPCAAVAALPFRVSRPSFAPRNCP